MKNIFKKITLYFLVATLTVANLCFFGCGEDNNKVDTNDLLREFNSQKKFLTFCDRPPTPSTEHLTVYKEAGFTHYLMTEDDYQLTDSNGQITADYLSGLQNCENLGLDVIIRNYHGDSDYFINNTDILYFLIILGKNI